MSLFVFIGHDVADSADNRKAHRTEHVARLDALDEAGRLIIAGPTPITHGESAMSGSVIIAEFDSFEDAQAWADQEPYLRGGVYSHVDIKPFIHVRPKQD